MLKAKEFSCCCSHLSRKATLSTILKSLSSVQARLLSVDEVMLYLESHLTTLHDHFVRSGRQKQFMEAYQNMLSTEGVLQTTPC